MPRSLSVSTAMVSMLLIGLVLGRAHESRAGAASELVDVVFVATGENFPDALAASAATDDAGPILLVTRDSIPDATVAELTRLSPRRIVVVGGTAVVSASVEAALAGFTSGTVTRLAGSNRYATAAAISADAFPMTGAVSCPGRGFFPDRDHSYTWAGGSRRGGAGSTTHSCALHLPHGVTITEVTFTLYDAQHSSSDTTELVSCQLYRVDLTGSLGATQVLAEGATTSLFFGGIIEVVDTSIASPIVDNARYGYSVQCALTSAGESLGIYGVVVEYRR